MQRLFSTFANGFPGAGLLLQRLITGGLLVQYAMTHFANSTKLVVLLPQLTGLGAGILLILGLWTPISGAIVGIVEMWTILAGSGDPRIQLLLSALGVSLAFIGPGAWSVDARIFGRRQISVPKRQDPLLTRLK